MSENEFKKNDLIEKPVEEISLEKEKEVNFEELIDNFCQGIDNKTESFINETEDSLLNINKSIGLEGDVVEKIEAEEGVESRLENLKTQVENAATQSKLEMRKSFGSYNSIESEIATIESFDDLINYVKLLGNVTAPDGFVYKSRNLQDIISGIRDGNVDLNRLTRAYGLRDKAQKLLSSVDIANDFEENNKGLFEKKENIPVDFSHVLHGEDFKNIFEKYSDPESRNRAIELSTILVTHIENSEKELGAVIRILNDLDFNNIDHRTINSSLITDLVIKIDEQVTHTDYDSSIDSAFNSAQKFFKQQAGVYYHGTNDIALNDIMTSGELRGENRGFEKDLDEINEIVQRVGYSGETELTGWYKINSEKKLFATGQCEESINYAKGSPEWLNIMTNGAYGRRDYNEAKKVVEGKIAKWQSRGKKELEFGRKNINDGEAEKIRNIFEKNWQKYGNSETVVLKFIDQKEKMMPIYSLGTEVKHFFNANKSMIDYEPEDLTPEENEKFIKENLSPNDLKIVMSNFLTSKRLETDKRIEGRNISTKDIESFYLPK